MKGELQGNGDISHTLVQKAAISGRFWSARSGVGFVHFPDSGILYYKRCEDIGRTRPQDREDHELPTLSVRRMGPAGDRSGHWPRRTIVGSGTAPLRSGIDDKAL